MPGNRVKIDINDNDGNKFTISLEGQLTRDRVLQILDFVDLMDTSAIVDKNSEKSTSSKFEKVQNVILRKFPMGWFTSQEIMIAYEDTLDEPIGLSTVSTYLPRLVAKGVLKKSGSAAKRKYKVATFIGKSDKKPKYKVPP